MSLQEARMPSLADKLEEQAKLEAFEKKVEKTEKKEMKLAKLKVGFIKKNKHK